MSVVDPQLLAEGASLGGGGGGGGAAAARAEAAEAVRRSEQESFSVRDSSSGSSRRWWWWSSAWTRGGISARERRERCATKTVTALATTDASPQARRSSRSGVADSSNRSAGGGGPASSGDALQQNSSRNNDSSQDAHSSRTTNSGLASSSGSGSGSSTSAGSDRSSSSCVDTSSSNIGRSLWSSSWGWTSHASREQQQEPVSVLARLLRRGAAVRRETVISRDVRGGRPTFERRRRRYRTVSWKYKKSIGFLASFVFLCNQILAPGLTSMPLTLIEYGWLPSLLVNLLFCVLSTLCSLVLLRSVTMIEGNHNFDERFEYSATLRHFLAPPTADLPAGAAAARSAASAAKAAAQMPTAAAGTAAVKQGATSKQRVCFFRSLWHGLGSRSSTQQQSPLSVGVHSTGTSPVAVSDAGSADGPAQNAVIGRNAAAEGAEARDRGAPAVTRFVSKFFATAAAAASHARISFRSFCKSNTAGDEIGVSGSLAAGAAHSDSGNKASDDSGSYRVFHPRTSNSSTRHSDYNQTSGSSREERAAAFPVSGLQAVGVGLPGFLLRRALYSMRCLSEGQPMQHLQQQQQQEDALAPQQQVQEEEQRELERSARDSDAAAAENERYARRSRQDRQSGGSEKGVHEPAAAEPTRATKAAIATLGDTAVSPAADSETCRVKSDLWYTLKYSGAPSARTSTAAADAVSPTGTATLSAARQYRHSAAQAFGDGLLQGVCFVAEVWSWLQRCVLALLLSPLSLLRWLWSLPHRLLQQLHAAVVRPPPLLPSSFPRLLSWLLHINTFLSTCSAALLVAYCIDCLLLRVFSCSLFIPLLPTHVSSGAVPQPHGDGWMFYCVTVCHWIGAVFALLLQPLCAVASLAVALFDSLAAVGAALSVPAAAATAALSSVFTLATENVSVAAAIAQMFDEMRHLGDTLLLQGSQLVAFYDTAAVRQISKWLPGSLLSLLPSIGSAVAGGFLEEQRIAAFYGVPRMPFLYVLPSQHHIEEVFSGVCRSSSTSSSTPQSSPAAMSSPYVAFLTASSETTQSDIACTSFDIASAGGASHASGVTPAVGGWGSPCTSAAAAAARTLVHECLPQCVSHMGISVGYIVTAAICLHLAAADLQENARMQLLSFGAIIAAVLQVSCSAALMLLFPTTAAAAAPKRAAAEALPDAAAAAGMLSVAAVAGGALPATATPRMSGGPRPTYNVAVGGMSAAPAPLLMATTSAPAAALAETEGYSLACCAAKLSRCAPALLGPPSTPATCSPALACRCAAGACNSGDSVPVSAAAAVAAAATNSAGSHAAADSVLPGGAPASNGDARAESPWPSMIVRGSGMGALVSTFVDAYSYSNALPSWANEIKDNIPVTQTLFLSTTFACTIYLLFGVLCAAAFPAFSASSNVLAAMLPSCQSLVAVSCICFFHIFALLPNIVTSQISRRYDLLNMAICLDKPSAFYVASTMPWMLYWLLTFSPVFATPSQLLTLLSNVLLNFVAPALVYVYALHATAPPRLHVSAVAGSELCSEGAEAVATRRMSAPQCAKAGAAAATDLGSTTAETNSHTVTYAVGDVTHEEEALLFRRQEQEEEEGEAEAPVHNWDWERREPTTYVRFDASVHSVKAKDSGAYETTSSSAVPSPLAADVPGASSFTDGVLAAPPPAPPHHILQLNRGGGGLDAADGGGLQALSAVSADAEGEEHGLGRAARRAAGDSLVGGLTMQAVPEEECDSEEEGHAAAAAGDDEENGPPYSSVPLSFSTLQEQHSQGSTLACSSGVVSRWSTRCFGDRGAAAAREYGSSGGEDFFRTQSSSGFKRTQSQNVLSFQARLLDIPEKVGSLRAGAAGARCVSGEAEGGYSLGSPSLQRRSTNVRMGQGRVVEALDARGVTAVTAGAAYTSSSQAGEKLGKMRVAGAVAGGGGARSREVQRQLQTWLEEYSRQMPESEVAQLLQRQQGEEQQEAMRLQQREAEIKKDLRKKVGNQWRRQHIFRADEELSPSSSYGGGCYQAPAATALDTVPEQSRSASCLPPSAKPGDGAVAEDAAAGSSGVSPLYEDREAAGNSKLRRRSSRSLSCARFLLPQQPVEPAETLMVMSAVGDDDGTDSVAAAEGAAAVTVAAPAASTAASDVTATSGGDRDGKQTAGTAGQGHQQVRAAFGKDASLRYVEGVSAGEEHSAERHAEGSGPAIVAAVAVGEVRRQQSQHLLNHEKEVCSGKQQLAGPRAPERRAEGAGTDASRSWDTTTRDDAVSDAVAVSSNLAAASAVLVADVMLQEKHQPHQVPQNGDFPSEETGAAEAAPAFVRRTTKRCARIDSVSVALQQRRRQQLLKIQQQQQEQHVQEQHVEEQERQQVKPKEHPYEHLQQQQQKPQQCREQQAEGDRRHQDEALPPSDADSQQPFQRSSVRHATCIPGGRAHGGHRTTAVKACSHAGDATAVGASMVNTASAAAAGDKADSAAEEVRETDGAESEVTSSGAGRGSSSSGVNPGRDSRNRLDIPNEENHLSLRSSISKDRGAHNEIGNYVTPSGCGLRLRIAAAVVRAVGWGNDVCCAVWAITQRKGRSILGVRETAEHSTVEGEGNQQQPVRRGIQLEVLQREIGQQNVGAPHVGDEQIEQRDVREARVRVSAVGSREMLQKDYGSLKATRETSGVNRSYALNPLAAAPPTGAAESSDEVGETAEGELCSAAVTTQIAGVVAEKTTESAAGMCAPATGLRPRGAKEGQSSILPHWCRENVILKKIYSGIRSSLGVTCCGISMFWNVLVSCKLYSLLARGAGDDVTLTRQQRQQQTTNGSQERVSFFPWLRSTEEQLVATYALLAVVLYCAAAALADEVWIPLEPAWLFIWRHSGRLLSLLWVVKWPPLPLPLLSVATWIGVTLHGGAAAAEHLLLLCRDSYIVGHAFPWLNVSVKKMQRLAGWLGRVSTTVARSVQQASGIQGDTDEVHTFFGPLSETLQHQLRAPFFNEEGTTAVEADTAARLGQAHSAAQVPLGARPALSSQALLYVTEELEGSVHDSAGLSAETFFIGLFLLIACTLPLLRCTSPARLVGPAPAGSRRQRLPHHLRS